MALGLLLVVTSVFALGTPPAQNPNEQSRLGLTASLVHHGLVTLDPVLDAYGTPFDRAERDGRVYTDKAPGLSLLGVPLGAVLGPLLPRASDGVVPDYWGLRHLLTWLLVVLPAVVLPAAGLRWLERGGVPGAGSTWLPLALVVGLATPVLTYGTLFFGHVPGGLLATLAALLVLASGRSERVPTPGGAAVAGLALAAAVSVEYPTALFGLVLGAVLVVRRAPVRTLAAFVGAGLIGMVPCLVYHHAAFGSPLATGYAFKADGWHAIVHGTGFMGVTWPTPERLWGVLAGARRGVLYYCPVLVLVPVGLVQLGRDQRGGAWPYGLLIGLCVAFGAGFIDWQAGWCASARHLVPGLILALVPLAAGLVAVARDARWAWSVPVLVGASAAGTWLSLALTPFFPEHFSAPLAQLVLPSLLAGHVAPTLLSGAGSDAGLAGVVGLAALSLGGLGWALARLSGPALSLRAVWGGLVAGVVGYVALVLGSASAPNAEQLQMVDEVLRRIGAG